MPSTTFWPIYLYATLPTKTLDDLQLRIGVMRCAHIHSLRCKLSAERIGEFIVGILLACPIYVMGGNYEMGTALIC